MVRDNIFCYCTAGNLKIEGKDTYDSRLEEEKYYGKELIRKESAGVSEWIKLNNNLTYTS